MWFGIVGDEFAGRVVALDFEFLNAFGWDGFGALDLLFGHFSISGRSKIEKNARP